ncbi:MAG: glutamine-synthetase adenylyltransferase, partial [Rhodospirillales bacterium]|nr:glutamine-synthetase adenylyltransferase [Rhodospirillales bacterium]
AAMIKARQIAGDSEAGALFLKNLAPFIWRKNLDFAAIRDIHSIKRQINAHRGGTTIAVAGHNVKLGRGGIREIEFFTQTQQLIWGGRDESLRRPATLAALAALAGAGQVTDEAVEELTGAYEFLRRLEHRLQMVDDRQTHEMPGDDEGLTHLAVFLGFKDAQGLSDELLTHLSRVESNYAHLFEDAPSLGGQGEAAGNLSFTGTDEDPDTLETIEKLGFTEAKAVSGLVRGWHHGRYRATRSERSRQLLTELMPVILSAFGHTPDPMGAFFKFDEFLSNLPSGVQLFSMFHARPELLDLLAEIMGSAPRLADHLSHHPSILDSLLEADFLKLFPEPADMSGDLSHLLERAGDYEDVLNESRRWANDRKFQVGIQILRN